MVKTVTLTNGVASATDTNAGVRVGTFYRAVEPKVLKQETGSAGVKNGSFGFTITGTPGRVVVFQSTTNLVDWVTLGTAVLGNDGATFSDPFTTSQSGKYYRTLQGP
jgi:hypothetical protein